MFEELEEVGKTIQDDLLDAGMPVHGTLGGDISKCPYYAAKMGTQETRFVVHLLPFLLHLCFSSLCHSGVRRHGVRRSARDGRAPTPYGAGPVRHVVRRAGWISGVVSDVRRPTPRRSAAAMKEVLAAQHAR